MKFKAVDYASMREYLKPVLDGHPEISKQELLDSMRLRWDMFWFAIDPVVKEGKFNQLFGEYNDNHIDTALKSIIRGT